MKLSQFIILIFLSFYSSWASGQVALLEDSISLQKFTDTYIAEKRLKPNSEELIQTLLKESGVTPEQYKLLFEYGRQYSTQDSINYKKIKLTNKHLEESVDSKHKKNFKELLKRNGLSETEYNQMLTRYKSDQLFRSELKVYFKKSNAKILLK